MAEAAPQQKASRMAAPHAAESKKLQGHTHRRLSITADTDTHTLAQVKNLKPTEYRALATKGDAHGLRRQGTQFGVDFTADNDVEQMMLELSVVYVQRACRARLALFKIFGTMLFARAPLPDGRGRACLHGFIKFPAVEVADSPFLVCSDKTSPRLLAQFLCLGPWKLPRPKLIVSTTGGAGTFQLNPPRLARFFAKGFRDACVFSQAFVTNFATDVGVAKLAAQAPSCYEICSTGFQINHI